MSPKVVLLIIAHAGYQAVEYGYTRAQLEKAGIQVVVASDTTGIADARPSAAHAQQCDDPNCSKVADEYPQFATVAVDLAVKHINPEDYDGIFFIGGPGALEFLDNQDTYALMQKVAQSGKPFGAICISPRILAKAGVLTGKKATGWNGDNKRNDIFTKYGAMHTNELVTVDGNLVTGSGPEAAEEFGKAIATKLLG